MIFSETELSEAYVIEIERVEDERGFFARTWDKNEFIERNLDYEFIQSSVSRNSKKGTFRGMHFQGKPYDETKIVRCTKGKIFDVIIDLRSNSKTFKKWFAIELSEDNHRMLYIPKGFAHGFQTLEDNSEVFYQNSEIHMPEFERGVRFDDPFFNIEWPINEKIVSEKDRSWPLVSNDEIKE